MLEKQTIKKESAKNGVFTYSSRALIASSIQSPIKKNRNMNMINLSMVSMNKIITKKRNQVL